ncbi:MAG: hypothetical protein GF419_10305 [Ignavibacteriales bacterium]|nr:hypothetical protein [Ignavibacteriales bacterium]
MNVFIGGSRKIRRLDEQTIARLENVVSNGMTILVGDANGADKAVQQFIAESGYDNVVVYHVGDRPRNNLGEWRTESVDTDRKTKDYLYYTSKDRRMAEDADYGFMIWDGESAGTYSNLLELVTRNKKSLVYFTPERSFFTVSTLEDLYGALDRCPEKARATIERKYQTPLLVAEPETRYGE